MKVIIFRSMAKYADADLRVFREALQDVPGVKINKIRRTISANGHLVEFRLGHPRDMKNIGVHADVCIPFDADVTRGSQWIKDPQYRCYSCTRAMDLLRGKE